MIRDETSDAPPAANGTMSVMLRSGHFSAEAWITARAVAANATAKSATTRRDARPESAALGSLGMRSCPDDGAGLQCARSTHQCTRAASNPVPLVRTSRAETRPVAPWLRPWQCPPRASVLHLKVLHVKG